MRRPPAVAFLLATVVIDMLGLGIVVPVVPALMTSITGDQAAGARWSGWINASYGAFQFLAAPLLGRLADRYGRRPVLVVSLGVLSLDYLAHAEAGRPVTLLAAHALAGALGGTMTVVNAYVADTVRPGDRARAYGQVAAASSVGFVAGPVLGGLLGAVSLRLPFLVAAALAGANALYGAVVLPESRTGDRRVGVTWRLANPVGSIVGLARRPGLAHLVTARALSDIARIAYQVTWTFVMAARFGWGTATLGLVLAAAATSTAVISSTLAGPYVRRLGARRAAAVSGWAGAVSLCGYGLAGRWSIVPMMALGSLSALGAAAFQSWIVASVDPEEHGAVQGSLTGISAIAEACVPAAAMAVFAWSLGVAVPGLVLVLAAAFAAASALVFARTPLVLDDHA